MPGRGRSDFLESAELYGYPVYVQDINTLIDSIALKKDLYYVGTSMGGLIGMMVVAKENHRIKRFVMNDIGAFVPKQALNRIANYFRKWNEWDSYEAARKYLSTVYEPFGMSEQEFNYFLECSLKTTEKSTWILHYDPKIPQTFELKENQQELPDADLYPIWNSIESLPIMLIRGATSDILLPEVVQKMKDSGPGLAEFTEYPNCGHAPMLFSLDQILPIVTFLSPNNS